MYPKKFILMSVAHLYQLLEINPVWSKCLLRPRQTTMSAAKMKLWPGEVSLDKPNKLTKHFLMLPATVWKSLHISTQQPQTNSCTCDCGELQRWLYIGHLDDHTGAELRFVLVLFCLIVLFAAVQDCSWRRFWLCCFYLLLVTSVALGIWWVSVSSFTPVPLSESVDEKTWLDKQEDSDTLRASLL